MDKPTFREYAKAKGYTVNDVGNLSTEEWYELQNGFLLFTVPELRWLVDQPYLRQANSGEWHCLLCKVEPNERLETFKTHFESTHVDALAAFYREQKRKVSHPH